MFMKKKEWETDPVLPSFKKDNEGVGICHPLTGVIDLYDNSGNYTGTVDISKLAYEQTLQNQLKCAMQSCLPCDRFIRVEKTKPDMPTEENLAKVKQTRIFDRDEKGDWYIKEAWYEDGSKNPNYKYFYANKEDYPEVPVRVEQEPFKEWYTPKEEKKK